MNTALNGVIGVHGTIEIVTRKQFSPFSRPVATTILRFWKGVQIVSLEIFIFCLRLAVDGRSPISSYLQPR